MNYKKILLPVLVLLAFADEIRAQESVFFPETGFHFGRVYRDSITLSKTFAFINRQTDAVTITHAESDCKCLSADFDPQPVAPGDTAEVVIRYPVVNRPGEFSKNAILTFSHGDPVTLNLRGTLVPPVSVKQQFIYGEGRLKTDKRRFPVRQAAPGQQKPFRISIYNNSGNHFYFDSAQVNKPDNISLLLDRSGIPPYTVKTIYGTYQVPAEPGYYQEAIQIAYDHATATADFTLVCNLPGKKDTLRDYNGKIAFDKGRLSFESVAGEENRSETVSITNEGSRPLEIMRIVPYTDQLQVQPSRLLIQPGKTRNVSVTLTAKELTEPLKAQILFYTSEDEGKIHYLPVSVEAMADE